MRIESISSTNYLLSATNNSKNDTYIVSNNRQIDKLTNLGAASFGLSLNDNRRIIQLDDETAQKEKTITDKMRLEGVSTPKIRKDNTYIIHGQTANAQTNPITQKHIKNVLKNILIMDKQNIGHGDIEQGHVFYSKNGNVEFDCFRFNWSFNDEGRRNWDFPKFCSPTNLKQFEGNSIGAYLAQINDKEKSKDFLKIYLKTSSDFHSKKAEYLEKSELGTEEQIEYEKLQAKILKNPDDDVVNLFQDKINLWYKDRLAFTEEDEGKGACGHKIDDKRTTKAVKMYFDNAYENAKYIQQINETKQIATDDKLKYLAYEEKYAKDMIEKTLKKACGNADWTINPENAMNISYRNVSDLERQNLKEHIDELKKISVYDKNFVSEVVNLKNHYTEILNNYSKK